MTHNEKIYSLWQDGMTIECIAEQLNESDDYIKRVINESPRERPCKCCGTVFVAKGKRSKMLYCSRRCCNKDYKNVKNAKKVVPELRKAPSKSLEDTVAETTALSKERGGYVSYGNYMEELRGNELC